MSPATSRTAHALGVCCRYDPIWVWKRIRAPMCSQGPGCRARSCWRYARPARLCFSQILERLECAERLYSKFVLAKISFISRPWTDTVRSVFEWVKAISGLDWGYIWVKLRPYLDGRLSSPNSTKFESRLFRFHMSLMRYSSIPVMDMCIRMHIGCCIPAWTCE